MNSYKTIQAESTGEYKDKGSKFIGYAVPVLTAGIVKEELLRIRKEHPKARHHCYAYRLGYDGTQFRANDDGEPSGTAGRPILAQIDSFGVTDVLIVVVRYFGGILLGTAGLTKAYKAAAHEALLQAVIIEKEIMSLYEASFNFSVLPVVMNLIKKMKIEITNKIIAEKCNFTLNIPRVKVVEFIEKMNQLNLEVKELK